MIIGIVAKLVFERILSDTDLALGLAVGWPK
jgi:hypothetical protein